MPEIPNYKKQAIDTVKLWEFFNSNKLVLPIDCNKIAEALNIHVVEQEFDQEDFAACLMIEDETNAIILNSNNLTNQGRKNFSIAHELGHFKCHKDKKEIRCSLSDLEDMGEIKPHSTNIEREANNFASNLLMPTKDFRSQIRGKIPDIGLVKAIRSRYDTSHMACAYRIPDLSNKPLAILNIGFNGNLVSTYRNELFCDLYLKAGTNIKLNILETDSPIEVNPNNFGLNPKKWTVSYSAMPIPTIQSYLVILVGENHEVGEADYLTELTL